MTEKASFTLQELHGAWNEANEKVRAHERLLASALEQFAAGRGPMPQEIIDEVQAMRVDCNAKFKALMGAVGQQR